MSTQKSMAWLEIQLAEIRLTEAAVIIAGNLVFEGKPPTEADIAEFRNAAESLARAHREYAKKKRNGK